jgi:hypothetical protein
MAKRSCTYPTWSTAAVHVLLESLDAFVEVVVVVRAYVDEYAMAENFTQVLLAGPVVCNVAREIEGLPVLDSLVVNLSSDFVPWLRQMSVDGAHKCRVTNDNSHLERVAVQALRAEDRIPDTAYVSNYPL